MASSRALVVGSGAVGLRTALELLKRNVSVVLRSPRHPLHASTCSVGAGGLWMPVHCQDGRATRWAIETLDELLPQGQDPENDLVELLYAVDYKQNKSEDLPEWAGDVRLHFQHFPLEMLAWQNHAFRLRLPLDQDLADAGYQYAWMWRTPVVDSPKMLQHYLDQVVRADNADVNVKTGEEYESIDQMTDAARAMDCDALFNCTGLAAKDIAGCESSSSSQQEIEEFVGGRGVTLRFDRRAACRRRGVRPVQQREGGGRGGGEGGSPPDGNDGDGLDNNDCVVMTQDAPWAGENHPVYLIPRGDVLVVGGTMFKGDTYPDVRDEERKQLLLNAERMGIDTKSSPPVGEWTGFRPYRSKVRVELDDVYSDDGLKVVHNYGHGGSGWTINVGTARECVDLVY